MKNVFSFKNGLKRAMQVLMPHEHWQLEIILKQLKYK